MGLGKTIELLACVFAHRKSDDGDKMMQMIGENTPKIKRVKRERVECVCGALSESSRYRGLWVQCDPYRKTGTTTTGLIYKDGVILAADTRATEGPIVADKNCHKIHPIAPNIYYCGAGTAADTEAFTDNISSEVKLDRYHTGREYRIVTTLTLLKSHLSCYQGHVSAALVLGGIDVTGPHLHTIYPDGSTETLPFATIGSGSLAAMAILESEYRQGLTKDEGIDLVTKAICSGIFNDMGSGSNVDVCVIEKGKTEYLRNHLTPNPRTYISTKGYTFYEKTEVLSTKITPLRELVDVVEVGGDAKEAHVMCSCILESVA